MAAPVISVNVGLPRAIEWLGKRDTTAIWKAPVEGRVPVAGVNLAGDDQADRRFHGGPDKAAYAYAREDYDWWSRELDRPLHPGTFGENLTLEGVDVTAAVVGERWAIGSALLEVAQPRTPCWKIGARMNDPDFPVWFAAAGRPGAYLRIVAEGEVGAGDAVEVVERPTDSRSARSPGSTTATGPAAPSSCRRPSWQRSGAPGSRSASAARTPSCRDSCTAA